SGLQRRAAVLVGAVGWIDRLSHLRINRWHAVVGLAVASRGSNHHPLLLGLGGSLTGGRHAAERQAPPHHLRETDERGIGRVADTRQERRPGLRVGGAREVG